MSTDISDDDIPKIAAVGRVAGELLDAHGALLLELAKQWERGLRAAATDATGGGFEKCSDRTCAECPDPDNLDPNAREHLHPRHAGDPTGAAAVEPDPLDNFRPELLKRLGRYQSDAAWIRDTVKKLIPPTLAAVSSSDDWCSHHMRLQIGEPRHRGDLCRFCYEFQLAHRQLPPVELLGVRHRYGKVTERQVKAALEREKGIDKTLDDVRTSIAAGRRKAG